MTKHEEISKREVEVDRVDRAIRSASRWLRRRAERRESPVAKRALREASTLILHRAKRR